MADLGYNVVRLGSMWDGVQPDSADTVNQTYVDTLKVIEYQ